MNDRVARLSKVLHDAARTHHAVYRIHDGADDDWASWYSDWLIRLSDLPAILGTTPVRSHLTCALLELDRDFGSGPKEQPWEEVYARELLKRFGSGEP
ncbi:MAG: hypothetical protein ABR518_03655 [Actinomycetota bacterium]